MAKTTAKKAVAAPASKSKEVAIKKNEVSTNVDVTLLMRQDAGDGVSTAAEDNIIPLIYILQAQSPVALKQKPEYIKGAVAGNIWPRGTKTVIDGEEEGLPIIPVAFSKWWVEWRPDRGGFAGRHAYVTEAADKGRPVDTEWHEDPKNPGMGKWTRENGNELVETREHAVLAYINGNWTGAVISMSGSNHTASRAWMGLMKKPIPDYPDERAPSYAYVYCAKTIAKTNDKGDWYGWQIEDGMGDGEVTFLPDIENGTSLYKAARQLAKDFKSGAKVADAPIDRDDAQSSTTNDEDDEAI